MRRYRYVILSSYGASWDISREIDKPLGGLMQMPWFGDLRYQDLQDLLDKGWRPVRETGMGGASATGGAAVAFSLILLEKDRSEAGPPALEEPGRTG
jgi:hypothetical protein